MLSNSSFNSLNNTFVDECCNERPDFTNLQNTENSDFVSENDSLAENDHK